MEVLNGILKEELNRLINLKKNYENKLKKYQKGSLIKKKIKGHVYYYLNYRDDKKNVFKYLGKLNEDEISKLEGSIKERRKLQKLFNQVKRDVLKLEKISSEKKK
ncbi:MAG: hypothetical protein FJW68_00110 [Actinobacteria bacterium]|nr:hypothetical protein [Actinomycetota bacterium]